MPDGLSSIEGLADKHRRVLDRHHVTDLRGLVQADRRVIYRAMANLRRPFEMGSTPIASPRKATSR